MSEFQSQISHEFLEEYFWKFISWQQTLSYDKEKQNYTVKELKKNFSRSIPIFLILCWVLMLVVTKKNFRENSSGISLEISF